MPPLVRGHCSLITNVELLHSGEQASFDKYQTIVTTTNRLFLYFGWKTLEKVKGGNHIAMDKAKMVDLIMTIFGQRNLKKKFFFN